MLNSQRESLSAAHLPKAAALSARFSKSALGVEHYYNPERVRSKCLNVQKMHVNSASTYQQGKYEFTEGTGRPQVEVLREENVQKLPGY